MTVENRRSVRKQCPNCNGVGVTQKVEAPPRDNHVVTVRMSANEYTAMREKMKEHYPDLSINEFIRRTLNGIIPNGYQAEPEVIVANFSPEQKQRIIEAVQGYQPTSLSADYRGG